MPMVEVMKHEYILKFAAEFIGSAMLVFFGCYGCISAYGHTPSLLDIALNAGMGIMMSITIFGFFSGSFINPAVTLAAVVCQILPIPVILLMIYIGLLFHRIKSISDGDRLFLRSNSWFCEYCALYFQVSTNNFFHTEDFMMFYYYDVYKYIVFIDCWIWSLIAIDTIRGINCQSRRLLKYSTRPRDARLHDGICTDCRFNFGEF
jgi:hypothetical protein